jgi:7-cyano-7-deazaguanine synthase
MASTLDAVAVLTSGGLDSAILVADLARQGRRCVPLYINCGLAWERTELEYLRRYLAELTNCLPNLEPLVVLDVQVLDLYGSHWSVTGAATPDESTPDEAVYLPGRNLLLASKALLWCHLNQVNSLALGVLASNPFPDASPKFFALVTEAVGLAVGEPGPRIILPYAKLHKAEVMQRGRGLPLEWSFSCIAPKDGLHCGHCNKCAERKKAFTEASITDPTQYAA